MQRAERSIRQPAEEKPAEGLRLALFSGNYNYTRDGSNQALNRLDRVDPTARQIVECRFFGGLSVEETGEALSLPESSIKRDWIIARAWLLREMHSIRQAHSLWADAMMQSR